MAVFQYSASSASIASRKLRGHFQLPLTTALNALAIICRVRRFGHFGGGAGVSAGGFGGGGSTTISSYTIGAAFSFSCSTSSDSCSASRLALSSAPFSVGRISSALCPATCLALKISPSLKRTSLETLNSLVPG